MPVSTRIVHVSPYYPPHTGGIERVVKMSAEGLTERGFDVHVITSTKSGLKAGTVQRGNLCVTVLKSFDFAHTPWAPALFWHLIKLPKNSLIHCHLAQIYYPELVYLVSKIRGIPYVVHFHLDVGPSGIFGKIFLLYKKLFWGRFLRGANKVIPCSPNQVAIVRDKYGVKAENIQLIENAVGKDFFTNRTYFPPKDVFKIVYIGRLAVQKRVERLVEAMSLVTVPARLTVVGDGEDSEKLKAQAQVLCLKNVLFVGKKNDQEMRRYQAENDLLAISSDTEGAALVLLEAMAGGMPILGTNVEGIRDLISDVGVLVNEPYAINIAKAIDELWANPEKLVTMSNKSSEKAKKYSWNRFIDQLEEVYKEVLK